MPKTNCNIIRDLLPSYLDELCSEESIELLEEHFKECQTCKKLYEQTKSEISHPGTFRPKEIDYFKKIKTNVSSKNSVILTIVLLMIVLLFYSNHNVTLYDYSNIFAMYLNYAFPLISAGLLFAVLPDYTEHSVPNKLKFSVLGIEFASISYIFVLILYMANSFANGQTPFDMPAEQMGPWLQLQLYAIAIGLVIAFATTLFLSVRKKSICPALHFLPLGGLALILEYNRMMRELTSVNLSMFIRPYAVFMVEIVVLVSIYMFMNKKKIA